MSLNTLVKTIQDMMRKDVGVDGDAQRISQMVWLLFLKIFDDKEQEWKITIKGYKSPLQSRFQWSNWAADSEGMTGEELIDFINNDLFPSLKKLATTAGVSPHGKVIGSVFEDAYNYMKSGTLLRQVINTIQGDVDFNSSNDRHLFNDIYEKILSDLQSAGNAGEYYTPRAVTQFMVDILNPQLGEVVFDPACGTGGFLVNVIEHIKKQFKTSKDSAKLQDTIHGVEKKPLPHMLAMTNMMLHGIDVPTNIRHDNTLSRPLKDYGPKDRVDIIITNPPFGGVEEDGIEKNFPKKYQTRETADLFMALIMHLLRPDTGRAAVVLPDGFLFGESTKTNLKKELLEEFNLHTIVRLPNGVFSPYTGIKTNILFFEKGTPTKHIWFFEHPYPEGYKSYSRGKPLRIEEFDIEKKWWHKRKQNENAWKISIKEIEERNYNLDCRNPHFVKAIHGNPDEMMTNYKTQLSSKNEISELIKFELKKANDSELLVKYFEFLYTTTDSISKLKNAILKLAITGKLLHENSINDSTHKSKDVENNSNSTKKSIDIKQNEISFELPDKWSWVRLNELGLTQTGTTPPTKNPENYGDFIPFIGPGDIKGLKIDYQKAGLSKRGLDKARLIPANSIMMVCIGGSIGKLAINAREVACNQQINTITPNSNTDLNYLFAVLQSNYFQNKIISEAGGSATPIINKQKWMSIPIPIPPYDIQKKISNRIDELFELCNSFEKQIAESTKKQTEILDAVLAQI
jgi:type I restriction enzyme M protein